MFEVLHYKCTLNLEKLHLNSQRNLQELLVYKFTQTKSQHTSARQVPSGDEDSSVSLTANTSTTSNSSTFSTRSSSSLSDGEYNLVWQRSFADPILVLDDADVTGDGVKEVIVVSLRGLHVLQVTMVTIACTLDI